MIKKYVTTFLMAALLGVMVPLTATETFGQTRYYTSRSRTYTTYKRPNVYKRHRKAFNLGIGTAAGAIVGALIGGKKGALIGGAAGLGGAALVNTQLRSKHYGRQTYARRTYRSY